jgi:Ti-type conjugative transfer relaxase TraA
MLSLRAVDENGFGAKMREWNRTALLEHWREAWSSHVNQRLAELGIEARIDHRSLDAQGIALEPQHKIGAGARRMAAEGMEVERLQEHRDIARENGNRIIANPGIALDAITRNQATFTRRELAKFVHRHSDGIDQFNEVMRTVENSQDLIRLGRDGRGEARFTSREMLSVEDRLHRATDRMAERERHGVANASQRHALVRAEARGLILSHQQRAAFDHLTEARDFGVVIGYAGAGKSALLGVAREAWEESGYRVRGAALSGIAAENLESGSGIPSRTLASLEHQWTEGRELLNAQDVLVIDEAGMIGSRQLERVVAEAERRGAKVVLVGDAEQLQAIEAGAAFRSITERHAHVEITEIRRQKVDWQRKATRELATGRTAEALNAYRDHGMVFRAESRDVARTELIERWDRDRRSSPEESRIILTHTNDEVRALNDLARAKLREAGELGEDVSHHVERGRRDFAVGDRVIFLKNDRGLSIKNGSLGIIEAVNQSSMTVRLDNGRTIGFDLKDYAHLDHGYAATIHKTQGVTVDRAHVLATPGLDRHATYVALSRHRESLALHFGRDDFADDRTLARILARDRAKDMASDYRRGDKGTDRAEAPISGRGQDRENGRERDGGRGIFANFRPHAIVRDLVALERAGITENPSQEADVIRRYARSLLDIARMEALELPVLPHQEQAQERARLALEAVHPHAAQDLASAFVQDPALINEAAKGKLQRTIQAMQVEAEIRNNPTLRAGRFVEAWQALARQKRNFERAGDLTSTRTIRNQMGKMAKGLERDPQVESLLRKHTTELGISMEQSRGVGQSLMNTLGFGRGRGLGI